VGTAAFDILGFGAVAVDELLYVDRYPPPDSKVRVRQRLKQCGGLTGTALVAAVRLGARCAYVGVLGEDKDSRWVAENLAREGVDFSHCALRSDARPARSTIIVDQAARTRTIFAWIEGAMGADRECPPAKMIRAARVLLVDHHGLEGTLRAARIARRAGVAVVADFERDPGPPFAELLELVDHLVLSRRFALRLSGAGQIETALKRLWHDRRELVAITGGPAGCWYVARGQEVRHMPVFKVEVVDTTGCGDVFHGAYAAALAAGMDADRRIAFASAAAALKAASRGGQSGCPTRDAVERLLGRHGRA
jgi:sulfofructose kinase